MRAHRRSFHQRFLISTKDGKAAVQRSNFWSWVDHQVTLLRRQLDTVITSERLNAQAVLQRLEELYVKPDLKKAPCTVTYQAISKGPPNQVNSRTAIKDTSSFFDFSNLPAEDEEDEDEEDAKDEDEEGVTPV